jgi:cytochrome c553
MKTVLALCALVALIPTANAADVDAGRAKVQSVCAACHGVNGVSVSDAIPNLAAQKSAYIEAQLRALRDGSRKNPIMGTIAGQLSDADIANVAAYFSAQPGATTSAKSDFLPNLAKTAVTFPDNYKSTFTKYFTSNAAPSKQVTYFYANDLAREAAKAGKPLPNGSIILGEVYTAKLDAAGNPVTGSDGFFVPDQLLFYTAMARDAGWGSDIPDMLRNEDWNYAVFTPAKERRAGINQAECLACHKPLANASFTFTLDKMAAAAKSR